MKRQIDALVSQILQALNNQAPSCYQLAMILRHIGMDGGSIATSLRDVLMRYAEDESIEIQDRQYASKQLESLPKF